MECFLWVVDHDPTDHLVYGHHNTLFSGPTLVLDQDQCLKINAKGVQYVHFIYGNGQENNMKFYVPVKTFKDHTS